MPLAVLAPLVIVHLALILYAVEGGLTAGEILNRTRGSGFWAVFYGAFVVAAALHAPVGLRNVLMEATGWRGRSLDGAMLGMAVLLVILGLRAVVTVVSP